MTKTCTNCNNKTKYECDGCDFGPFCGQCARLTHVIWIDKIMTQRLCPDCRCSGDNPMRNGFYDARKFDIEDLRIALKETIKNK